MDDLFAVEQPRAVPEYGSLTPAQERALYDNDRATWYLYVAEAMAKKLTVGGAESIAAAWPLMSDQYKEALWPYFSKETRELVRLVRESLSRPVSESIAA